MSSLLYGTDSGGPVTYVLREGEKPVEVSDALAGASSIVDQIGSPDTRAGKGSTNQIVNNGLAAAGG